MDYIVFTEVNGDIGILLESQGIFQGSLHVHGNHFIEKRGGQATLYDWNGMFIVAIPLKMTPHKPYPLNTACVYFSIDDQDNINVQPSLEVSLSIGQSLLLTRLGSGASERILYSNDGVIEFVDDMWVAKNSGKTRINIIPSGYNWDKAIELEVTVVE